MFLQFQRFKNMVLQCTSFGCLGGFYRLRVVRYMGFRDQLHKKKKKRLTVPPKLAETGLGEQNSQKAG